MTAVIWFKQDLRLQDNTAVAQAWHNHERVVALVTQTEKTWQKHHWAPIKRDLYERRLNALASELAALGVPLHVINAESYCQVPACVLQFMQKQQAQQLYFNREYPLDEKRRDQAVVGWLQQHGIQSHVSDDLLLVVPERIYTGQGHYYKKFTPFYKRWLAVLAEQGVSAPQHLPAKGPPIGLPEKVTLFGDKVSSAAWRADTQAIHAAMEQYYHERLHDYAQNRDIPALNGTSALSPYIENGSLGVATLARKLAQLTPDFPDGLEPGASTWLSELAWREFYQHLMWHVPRLSQGKGFQEETDAYPWVNSEERFTAWCEGRTGFPIIDAGMRQLKATGWMHNRVRMLVASFLVKDLHLDWRLEEAYFMQNLVDGSFAANNGGWQWSAGTGTDAAPYFRVFNPERQSEKFDPAGQYIRIWVKELADVPAKHIHAPWQWLQQYARANPYPKPIVEHSQMRELFTQTFKQVKNGLL
ncbi:deoxyribodipyrimidine photo-lyase [Aliidiomarina taiwanensis]|uniref:Deoxyribodipyrimidine photo-lyase n=1 Tax=Aliidiomarina taiwanensis TaxID=946228 RepID=A0A432X9L5_9GAMM|nr:deoxyribodipyrimidine photo-lyase [Aliidiomarina taiwanensis]RUO44014.1 deoxyribodipyrimidine photo-lyase [Aliidiomarina taiwanensis]